ncbi:GDSL-type esterase/lipase family protein [Streptomyces sp. NPDC008150]|uniref:SGNH/GDSL hydrolase family protein n=1 Tax=Streptomyces sp. NPDC008150 TaxID=3364816 RepID=UPI0036EC3B4B
MSRHLFGGSPADYAMEKAGTQLVLRPGAVGTVWDAAVEGNQYTDLTDTTLSPITQVTADSVGGVTFYGPDGITHLYVDFGFGRRLILVATDIGDVLSDLQEAVDALSGPASGSIPKSLVTTKGDIVAATGSGAVDRVPAGTVGQTLVSSATATTGVRWSNAWRRRTLPHLSTADAVSTITAPTITVTQQATSTITSAQALLAPDTGPFLYCGAGSFSYGTGTPDSSYYLPLSRYPNTYASGQGNYAVEFWTDAAQFEIKFKMISTTATKYRLSVDDRKMTDLAVATGATAAGSSHVLKFVFSTATPRKIRFDFTTMPFGGLFLPPGATAWKPATEGGRLGVFGDSICDGSAENTGAGIGTWFYRLARLLGCTDAWDQARGGTGYITPGTFATLANRVATDITPYAFDRLIVWAGYNDNGGSQSDIATAAASLYTTLKSVIAPGGDIFVIGCYAPTGSPAGSITNTDTTLRTAAAAAGLPFVSPLTGTVYDSAGNAIVTQGAWITAANASGYIGTDAIHPNDNCHVYLSRRVYQAWCAAIPA